MKNIKFIRKLNWEEVFGFWYESEGKRENWAELSKKRGFASWAEWRIEKYAIPLGCREAEWGLYEIDKPAEVISGFYGGPFRTWIERYYIGADTKLFADLVNLPEINTYDTVISMSENFPMEKKLTFLSVKDKIYTIEGMHRCCALALLHKQGQDLPNKIEVAIGSSKLDKLPRVGKADN